MKKGQLRIEEIRGPRGELLWEKCTPAEQLFWKDLGSWHANFGMRNADELIFFMLRKSTIFPKEYNISLMATRKDELAAEIEKYLISRDKAEDELGARIVFLHPGNDTRH